MSPGRWPSSPAPRAVRGSIDATGPAAVSMRTVSVSSGRWAAAGVAPGGAATASAIAAPPTRSARPFGTTLFAEEFADRGEGLGVVAEDLGRRQERHGHERARDAPDEEPDRESDEDGHGVEREAPA